MKEVPINASATTSIALLTLNKYFLWKMTEVAIKTEIDSNQNISINSIQFLIYVMLQ